MGFKKQADLTHGVYSKQLEEWQKTLTHYEAMQSIIKLITPVFEKWEGKPLNQYKRFKDAIQAVIPDYTVSYGTPYSWFQLRIWGKGIEYGSSIMINCGYTGSATVFSMAWLKEHEPFYFDGERLQKEIMVYRRRIKELQGAFDSLAVVLTWVEKHNREFGDIYPVEVSKS